MPTLFYFYRTGKKNANVNIRARFRHGKTIECYGITNVHINSGCWSRKKQKVEPKTFLSESQVKEINTDLNEIDKLVMDKWRLLSNRELPDDWLQTIIEDYYKAKSKAEADQQIIKTKETLFQFMDRYHEEIKSGKRLNQKNQKYSPDTVKSRKNSYKVIKDCISEKYPVFDYNDVNLDFYKEFVTYLNAKKYSPQTSGKHIKALKEIMTASLKEGAHKNINTTLPEFKTISGSSDTIYLTAAEVKAIEDVDLTAFPDLQISRDVFLCGIYIAQRYSDYSRISQSNIIDLPNGRKAIKMKQGKGKNEVVIPMAPVLDKILKKYNYNLPTTYSQKLNEDIKNIGYLAKITYKVEHYEQKGAETIKYDIEKYKLITSHTARRTGATLLYLETRDTLSCMKITGHKTEKEFLKYIRINAEENAILLSDADYFSW